MPAVVNLFFCAMATILPTPSARSSGVTAAVCSKYRLTIAGDSPAPAIGCKSASGSCTRAKLSEAFTTRRKLSSSNLLVVARAVRPPNTVRTETATLSSSTFW